MAAAAASARRAAAAREAVDTACGLAFRGAPGWSAANPPRSPKLDLPHGLASQVAAALQWLAAASDSMFRFRSPQPLNRTDTGPASFCSYVSAFLSTLRDLHLFFSTRSVADDPFKHCDDFSCGFETTAAHR